MSAPKNNSHGDDPFAPPTQPILVFCLHCGREYDSWQMQWIARPNAHGLPEHGMAGDWCCATPGCDGVGFGFDIHPADEEWIEEHGYCGDDEDEDYNFEGFVDHAVMDQFWRTDSPLAAPDWPDELSIDTLGEDEHPLLRMLPPEELPEKLKFMGDDIPF